MRKAWFPLVALVGLLMVFAFNHRALRCSFVFDDWVVIANNPALNSESLTEALAFNPFRSAVYSTYWVQIRMQGAQLDASSFRAVNILLHWLAGLIVTYLTFVIFFRKKETAILAGILFWVNPVFLEAVNFILGRGELMLAVFYFGALCFYLDRKRPWISGAGFFICFALALLCKEVAITLPAAALLLSFYRAEKWKRPEVLGGCALVVIFIILRLNWTIELAKTPEGVPSWPGYFLDQNWIFWLATLKTLIPVHLNFDYQLAHRSVLGVIFLVFNLIFFALLLLSSIRSNKSGWLALIYVLIYLPLGLIPLADPLRESRLYLPGAWLMVMLAMTAGRLLEKHKRSVAILTGVIIICLSLLSLNRAGVWRSEPELWRDALAKSPQKFRPAYNYATALRRKLELDRARQVYLWAKKIDPENEKVDWALALIEEAQKYLEKIEQFRKSLESTPEKVSPGQ